MPFQGEVETRWLRHGGPDRKMQLLADFAYIDRSGYAWLAVKGDTVDGASIPDELWSRLVGTPFVGDYRRATVVHDVACQRQIKTSREAHRMFYQALLEDGVAKERALLMYTAVRLFGPKWDASGLHRGLAPEEAAAEIDFDELESALDEVVGEI